MVLTHGTGVSVCGVPGDSAMGEGAPKAESISSPPVPLRTLPASIGLACSCAPHGAFEDLGGRNRANGVILSEGVLEAMGEALGTGNLEFASLTTMVELGPRS